MINAKENYEYLFGKYGEKIYRTIFCYCKNVADSEDIMQETFLKLFETNEQFESEEHIKNWLYKVAINRAINVKKSKWYKYQTLDETYAMNTEEQEDLYESIMKLPDKYRVVIILYYYEGYAIKEIAQLLSKSVSTINTQLQRARKRLKKYIEE